MSFVNVPISPEVFRFLTDSVTNTEQLTSFNARIKKASGINDFCENGADFADLKKFLKKNSQRENTTHRREFGDYQTNKKLAERTVDFLSSRNSNYEFCFEPTCGKGNFLLAAISNLPRLKKVVGIEIYKPYVWETKFSILKFFVVNEGLDKPDVDIIHHDFFAFDLRAVASATKHLKTLILGNPPWITNAELGSIGSDNLPNKRNYNALKGLDAITGKGNFDIGEFITTNLIQSFQHHNGTLALLVKNTVIKNITKSQKNDTYRIGKLKKMVIDSKKEFNVSVNASLFHAELNHSPTFTCKAYDFYSHQALPSFGWVNEKFTSSTETYIKVAHIDGKSPFVWRSGMKHDCTRVMELVKEGKLYSNKLSETVSLEPDLVYGFLKSSDLKGKKDTICRKHTIVTQKKIGQETTYIKAKFPKTYRYLARHQKQFEQRKSSIYKNKPLFSIFGIGEYSFAKYKVAISGLYKTTNFTLIKPIAGKPIMLDDTCYFIGFDSLTDAKIATALLNSSLVQDFLISVIFSDSKRAINKDILMRIDLRKVYEMTDFQEVIKQYPILSEADRNKFAERLQEYPTTQLALF